MRKLVMTAALGCLAIATAADAQLAAVGPSGCAYADQDMILEMARLDPPSESDRPFG